MAKNTKTSRNPIPRKNDKITLTRNILAWCDYHKAPKTANRNDFGRYFKADKAHGNTQSFATAESTLMEFLKDAGFERSPKSHLALGVKAGFYLNSKTQGSLALDIDDDHGIAFVDADGNNL